MSEIPPETFPKYRKTSVLDGLPANLKDPKNYEKIQRALLETLAGRHSHGEMETWAKCLHCQNKLRNHGDMMRKLGFRSGTQYMAWKKVMHMMINPKFDPLPKYDD